MAQCSHIYVKLVSMFNREETVLWASGQTHILCFMYVSFVHAYHA